MSDRTITMMSFKFTERTIWNILLHLQYFSQCKFSAAARKYKDSKNGFRFAFS
jgi:hypothetical protein